MGQVLDEVAGYRPLAGAPRPSPDDGQCQAQPWLTQPLCPGSPLRPLPPIGPLDQVPRSRWLCPLGQPRCRPHLLPSKQGLGLRLRGRHPDSDPSSCAPFPCPQLLKVLTGPPVRIDLCGPPLRSGMSRPRDGSQHCELA